MLKIFKFRLKTLTLSLLISMILGGSAIADQYLIKNVQTWLTMMNYNPGPIDGAYGSKTAAALESFYENTGGEFDGVLDEDDFWSVYSSVASSMKEGSGLCVDNEICRKLNERRTINPFMAWRWGNWKLPMDPYSLYWNPGSMPERTSHAINLESINYAFWLPADTWAYAIYPGIEKYITDRRFSEYDDSGAMFALNLVEPTFPTYITKIISQRAARPNIDGVLFDWWVDFQPGGFTRSQVRNARISIVREIRRQLGDELIIMANVLWEHDEATVEYLNGAYLEFYKDGNERRLYNLRELQKMERSIDYYNTRLAEPKLIAIDGHRQTYNLTDEDRNTSANRQMAKLLAAMSIVSADNGYILYGDGGNDDPNSDHYHLIYDFYSFDIGKPIGPMIEISSGLRMKEHEKGFVAYNLNNRALSFTRLDGQKFMVPPRSGMFCKDSVSGMECLSNN